MKIGNEDSIFRYQPLWGTWYVDCLIGQGSYGRVYKVVREDMGQTYTSAVKIITIPSEMQYEEAEATLGSDQATLSSYFEDAVKNIVKEVNVLHSLSGNTNVVGYHDHYIAKKDGQIGWDILIRMEYVNSLARYLKDHSLTNEQVIRLGMDICTALELCSKKGIIHRDIKLDNIFINEDGAFKLGDFGIAMELSRSGHAASLRGTPLYMAPEVFHGDKYDATADIYSLGLVLYRLLNYGRMPFLPPWPERVLYNNNDDALARRMQGEALSSPAKAREGLRRIILKACAYKPEDRFGAATEMKCDLERELAAMGKEERAEIVIGPALRDDQTETSAQNIVINQHFERESKNPASILAEARNEALAEKTPGLYSGYERLAGTNLDETVVLGQERMKAGRRPKHPGTTRKSFFIAVVGGCVLCAAFAIAGAAIHDYFKQKSLSAAETAQIPSSGAPVNTPSNTAMSLAGTAAGPSISGDSIAIAWYPDESGSDYAPVRNEVAKLISQATGKDVVQILTTDDSAAIGKLASGEAQIACDMDAEGYIKAKQDNSAVMPLFVNSDNSGTLDYAMYYSWICVPAGSADQYMDTDGKYSIANIQGKRFSFASNGSISGFRIPMLKIFDFFNKQEKWAKLTPNDISRGGSDKFFSEVLFGGSHQGSAINLLSGKADVATFCDTELVNFIELISGASDAVGAVYSVKHNAGKPFNLFAGKSFMIIHSTPVLYGPFAYNSNVLGSEDVVKIQNLFTSDATTKDKFIYKPRDSQDIALYAQNGKNHFVLVKDEWYDPIRNLSN